MARVLLMLSVRTIVALLVASVAIAQMASQSDQNATPHGLLETNTLLAIYGRGLGVAPILGRLGTYHSFEEMAAGTRDWVSAVESVNGHKKVIEAIHLIYAMAVPCKPGSDCLDYLETDAVEKYIQPAADRGWVVILDSQLGRSNPVEQVRRMIELGYLRYDNVHVAIDPEFHVYAGHDEPGVPIGAVDASQVNQAQSLLNRYVEDQHLRTKKVLIIHQFGDQTVHDGVPYMIRNKEAVAGLPEC